MECKCSNQCKYCNKQYTNIGGLSAHEKTCERIYPFKQSIIESYATNNIRTICKQFNIGQRTAVTIIKDAGIHIRTNEESIKLTHELYPEKFKHTPESKEKIRVKRLAWMKSNPDKTAWRTRNKPSYPEQLFINMCNELNLCSTYDIVREYSVHPYFIDFAFTNAKIAIEVDGSQHWLNADRMARDISKDELLRTNGWRIMRIPAFKIQVSYNEIKQDVINFLTNISITEKLYKTDIIEYEQIKKTKHNIRILKKTSKQAIKLTIVNARKIDFDAIYPHIGWTMQLAKKWNMTSQSVGRYCRKNYGIGVEHLRITKENILDCFSKNMNLTQIGNLYSLDSSTVSDYCKKYNITVPKYVVKVDWKTIDLRELLKTKTVHQIATFLDIKPDTVYKKIRTLGIIV